MTLQQLKYAVEIEKCGSLSKAAKRLFVSQPNISNAIKDLESEVGITIFKRNNRGVQVSEQGIEFLTYARSILSQCEEIKSIYKKSNSSEFRLITINYSPIMESFVRFVKTKSEKDKINFSLKNARVFEVIDSVYKQESDLGILALSDGRKEYLMKCINDRFLSYQTLGTLSLNVNLRKNHPLLMDEKFSFDKLKDYPFVHYRDSLYNNIANMENIEGLDFVKLNKEIYTFDRETKCRIVTETNAYSIGCDLHPNFLKYFNWITIPIPGVFVELGYIKNKNKPLNIESEYFLEILKNELKDIIL